MLRGRRGVCTLKSQAHTSREATKEAGGRGSMLGSGTYALMSILTRMEHETNRQIEIRLDMKLVSVCMKYTDIPTVCSLTFSLRCVEHDELV